MIETEPALVNLRYVQGMVRISGSRRVQKVDKKRTYNLRTLLRDEQIHKLEKELKETRLVWDGIWSSEKNR